MKSQPQLMTDSSFTPEPETDFDEFDLEVSKARQCGIWIFQLLALVYVSVMLILPAYLSVSAFTTLVSAPQTLLDERPWLNYMFSLTFAPLAWILCIFATCISITIFGNSFLRPNYTLNPEVSIWSADFVKWWALYKVQEVSCKVLAVYLRGTVFLNWWFEMLGAKLGSSVLLDTVDITDPSLVLIGDGAVISEGTLIQSHEVKNGVLSLQPIKIARKVSVGPYAVIQKGSVIGEEAEVAPLQKSEGGKPILKSTNANYVQKVSVYTYINFFY